MRTWKETDELLAKLQANRVFAMLDALRCDTMGKFKATSCGQIARPNTVIPPSVGRLAVLR